MGDGFHWSFLSALERFLRYGPVGEKEGKRGRQNQDRDVTVQRLVLDVSSAEQDLPFPPDDVNYQDWLDQHSPFGVLGMWPKEEEATGPSLGQVYDAAGMLGLIRRILEMGRHTAKYGQIVCDHVGSIELRVEGKLHNEIGVAQTILKKEVGSRKATQQRRGSIGASGGAVGGIPKRNSIQSSTMRQLTDEGPGYTATG
ncbi:uncharacterized protein N7459_004750 [Penicillium hispanicum]|uniref:uncharacterized protein n=1 Tax=Penicillium hispanicum TaxID=1080232 RepID=UPI002541FC63|nr:uncharacterized protein N7459_004750 [Penicillium hispanicum]KAJ5584950.1 hypothetical protein N7459_004750 [Penicillium hispanicum]